MPVGSMIQMGCGHFMEEHELNARIKAKLLPGGCGMVMEALRVMRPVEAAQPCNECLVLREANGL